MLKNSVEINGFWFPNVKEIQKHTSFSFKRVKSLKYVIKHCDRRRIVVQAGGSYGIWPKMLAHHFDYVYTFEPESISFQHLCMNCPSSNIFKFPTVLGKKGDACVDIKRKSFASHTVIGHHGYIPVLSIDELNLPVCDAILLDIEGFELFALKGAIRIIEEFTPLILVEDRPGMGNYFNIKDGEVVKFIKGFGYEQVADIQKDKIFVKGK